MARTYFLLPIFLDKKLPSAKRKGGVYGKTYNFILLQLEHRQCQEPAWPACRWDPTDRVSRRMV